MFPVLELELLRVPMFGLCIFLGFLLGSLLLRFRLKEDAQLRNYSLLWFQLTVATVLGGLLGARLWEAVKYPTLAIGDPFDISAGSAWYGGFLASTVIVLVLLVCRRVPILRTLDVMVPSVCLGQVLGRLGCFSGGCCFGVPTTMPWGVIVPNSQIPIPLHPSPLYEAGAYLIMFFVLLFMLRRRKNDGTVFASYAILTGTARFLIEYLRVNPRTFFGFTEAQVISICLVLCGMAILGVEVLKSSVLRAVKVAPAK